MLSRVESVSATEVGDFGMGVTSLAAVISRPG